MKLRLPQTFRAALAAVVAAALPVATTVATGTLAVSTFTAAQVQAYEFTQTDITTTISTGSEAGTYSGPIINWDATANTTNSSGKYDVHAGKYDIWTSAVVEEDGVTRNDLTKDNNGGTHYDGQTRYTGLPGTPSNKNNAKLWHMFTGSTARDMNVYGYGVTLRLAGATGAVTLDASFSPMTLGGLIVADSDTASYTLGRAGQGKDNAIRFLASTATGAEVNMYIGANTTLNGSAYTVDSGGTWKVASGKTLDFTKGNVTVSSGVGTIISGGGTVKFSTALTNNGNLMVASGSTMELAANVSGSGHVGGYVDAATRGSGTLSNFIKVGSDAIYDSVSGKLQLFSADYVKLSDVEFTRSGNYISSTYTSSLILDWANGNGTWSNGMADGWYLAGTTTSSNFQNNDNVRFSSATPQSVTVASAGVTVADMSVTGDYTFSGGAVTATDLTLDNSALGIGTGGSISATTMSITGTASLSLGAGSLTAGTVEGTLASVEMAQGTSLSVGTGSDLTVTNLILADASARRDTGTAPTQNYTLTGDVSLGTITLKAAAGSTMNAACYYLFDTTGLSTDTLSAIKTATLALADGNGAAVTGKSVTLSQDGSYLKAQVWDVYSSDYTHAQATQRNADAGIRLTGGVFTIGQGTTNAAGQGNTRCYGPIMIDSGAKLRVWAWTITKLNINTADKVNITSHIYLNGGTLFTEDGSYYFSKGVSVMDTSTITFQWAKGNVMGAIDGTGMKNKTLNIIADRSNDQDTPLISFAAAGDFDGTVDLKVPNSTHNSWGHRVGTFIISHSDAFKNAIVNTNPYAALHLNTAQVNVAGLSGSGVISLSSGYTGSTTPTSSDLRITGHSNGEVTFGGTTGAGINLILTKEANEYFNGANINSLTLEKGATLKGTNFTVGDLAGSGDFTFGDAISGLNITSSLSVAAKGTLTFESGASYSLGVESLEKTHFDISNAGDVTLGGSITTYGTIYAGGSGKLVLDGAFSMAHMDDLECSEVHTVGTYTDITNTGGGYLSASYLLVRNTGGSTIELGSNASFSCAGQESQIMLMEDANGTTHAYVSTDSTGGDYYINQGTITYDAANNWAYSANTTGLVLNGGNLILNKNLRLDKNGNQVDITVAQNGTITLNSDVVLNRSDMLISAGKTVTLEGNGTVDIGTYGNLDYSNLAIGSTWKGVLLIHGVQDTLDINLDITELNNLHSTIALSGFTAGSGTLNYLAPAPGGSATGPSYAFGRNKIMLIGTYEEGNAFTVTNGYSNTYYVIAGICGDGDFVKKGGTNNFRLQLTGDSSDWSGKFIVTSGQGTLSLAGTEDIGLGVTMRGTNARLNLAAEGSGNKTFSGVLDKGNGCILTLDTNGTASLTITKAAAFDFAYLRNGTTVTFADNSSIVGTADGSGDARRGLYSEGVVIKNSSGLTVEKMRLLSNTTVLNNSTVKVTGSLDARTDPYSGNLQLENYSTLTLATATNAPITISAKADTTITIDPTSTMKDNGFDISGRVVPGEGTTVTKLNAVVTMENSAATHVNAATSIENAVITYTGTGATLSSALSNSTLTHSGSGTLTLTGATGSGDISVTTAASVLKLEHATATTTTNAITYELGGGLQTGEQAETVSGKVLVKAGTLTLSGTGMLTLDNLVTGSTGVISNTGTTIVNTLDLATTLTNTGTLTIDAALLTIDSWGLTHFNTVGEGGSTYTDDTLHITTSGFASGSYVIVKSTGEGTLTVTNEGSLTALGLTVQGNDLVYGNAQDLQTYVVNEDLSYSGTAAHNQDDVTLRITTNNTMTIDCALRTGTKVEVNNGGTLKITADNTLASADAKFDAGSKLNISSGTLTFSNLSSDDQVAVTFGNNWATLALTGDSTIDTTKQTFNFGGNNTHLVIAGTTTLDGTLNITRTSTGNHHLLLRGGNSLTLADGASLTYVTDTFAAKGGGVISTISSTNTNATEDVELSPWQEAQKFENLAITLGGISGEGRAINATLTGSDVTVKNANFTFGTNVTSLTSFDASTGGTVVFNGNISISGTTTTGANTATFKGTANLTGDATFGGTATFTGAATLGGNATFTGEATFNEAASITGNTTISNGAAFGKAATFGGNVSISGGTSFAGNTTFNGASVTIKAGTKVNANSVNMYLANGSDLTLEAGASLAHDGFTYSVAADAAQSGTIHKVDNEKSLTGQEATRFSAIYSDGATLSNMTVTQSDTDKHINMSFDGVDYVNTGHETRLMGATNNFSSFELGLAQTDDQASVAGTLYLKSDAFMVGKLTLAGAGSVVKMDADRSLTVNNGKIQLTGREGITDGATVVTVDHDNGTISGEASTTRGVTIQNVNVFIDNEDTENAFTWSAKVDDAQSNVTNTGMGTVTMTADSTMATLSANHGNLILTGSNTASEVVVSPSGTLTLAESGNVTSGALTIGKRTQPQPTAPAPSESGDGEGAQAPLTGGTLQNVTANATSISATDSKIGHGTMDSVHITLDGAGSAETSYQITQVDMTNTLVDLRNASSVEMADVTIGSGTVISTTGTGEASTLNIRNSTLVLTQTQLAGSGASVSNEDKTVGRAYFDLGGASLGDSLSLLLTSDFMKQFAKEAGTAKLDMLEIYLDNVTNANALAGEGTGIFSVASEWGDNYVMTVNNRTFIADGSSFNGLVLNVGVSPAIPEPTTGALSVLALAALAARRRRREDGK